MKIKKILSSKNENSQTFFNFLSTAISSGIALITMPIFTRILGAEQFGLYSIYHAWLTIVVCVMGFNINASLGTALYKYKEKYFEYRSSVLAEGTIISFAIVLLLLLVYPYTGKYMGYSFGLFVILLLHGVSNFITNVAATSWVYEKKAANNMLLTTFLLVTTSIISITMVIYWNSTKPLYYGRVLGTAIPHFVAAVIVWIVLFKKEPFVYNKKYWRYGLTFGLPMVFHTLSHQILGQSDRLMMQWFAVSGPEIGVYSFFYSFVAILSTILNALNTSWCPFLYDDLAKEKYDILNVKVKNYVEIITVFCLGFLLVSREVMKLFANSEYWGGANLIPILVMVVFCTFFYQFAVNYEFFSEQPKYVAIGTISAAICNIVLNALLIPKYEMYGAAIATLLSYILLAAMHTTIVKRWKLNRYPLSYKPVIAGLIIVLTGCVLYYFMADMIIIRWALASMIGAYLVIRVIKRKKIF